MSITEFTSHHFRHFNAATLIEASDAWVSQLESGGKMFVSVAGAMSTAELGIQLAELIRRDKVHAICCTGANLEEDLFNLVAHDHYTRIADWRILTPADEKELESRGLNRVTDTCIPEEEAFRALERPLKDLWATMEESGERLFPHEVLFRLILEGTLVPSYQIDPNNSWMVAAAEKNLPVFVPGWEDSTLGNVFVANVLSGTVGDIGTVRSGLEYMAELARWYTRTTMEVELNDLLAAGPAGVGPENAVAADDAKCTVGFFQIGGGIAGDFPICVVPMILQDLRQGVPYWNYFCQIGDSTTSYGSYSGAIPTEKITWGKLDETTPMFVIESDATIVAPLMFARVLEA